MLSARTAPIRPCRRWLLCADTHAPGFRQGIDPEIERPFVRGHPNVADLHATHLNLYLEIYRTRTLARK